MSIDIDWDALARRAWKVREEAYAPYSDFKVGAALLTATGEICGGCNVENVSFGLTICAERAALFAAVGAGHRKFAALAIAAETEEPVPPCGACRQVLAEFAPDLEILSLGKNGGRSRSSLSELLPSPFRQIRE